MNTLQKSTLVVLLTTLSSSALFAPPEDNAVVSYSGKDHSKEKTPNPPILTEGGSQCFEIQVNIVNSPTPYFLQAMKEWLSTSPDCVDVKTAQEALAIIAREEDDLRNRRKGKDGIEEEQKEEAPEEQQSGVNNRKDDAVVPYLSNDLQDLSVEEVSNFLDLIADEDRRRMLKTGLFNLTFHFPHTIASKEPFFQGVERWLSGQSNPNHISYYRKDLEAIVAEVWRIKQNITKILPPFWPIREERYLKKWRRGNDRILETFIDHWVVFNTKTNEEALARIELALGAYRKREQNQDMKDIIAALEKRKHVLEKSVKKQVEE